MGLYQSPFDADNSEFYLPLLDLKKAPQIAKELTALFEEKRREELEKFTIFISMMDYKDANAESVIDEYLKSFKP